ncbi:SPOR domain-containing protein [Campylobacter jejuni]|uniref:SPOR domain-containing protein n=1 Tax=Campylobacter jejuni TaxID=197 RepID=A0A5T0Q2V4_CAMJU|nr:MULTISPECIES: SPOR domain-containing protein [Campylobacter]EAH9620303.1 SPOR domain-containing protein [Campylobacter jejuni]EAI4881536.1 SPOR domain-containing protein [Campylobacter jejuni]EAI7226246.1 SPOR domain-containing protein [Campylobacter jejuni]EAI8344007.1 SPOR domain-containing protein [Campylobacter jejuni]EAI9164624.1 SPOR domain-containing protein [Campylobacter jejuni]
MENQKNEFDDIILEKSNKSEKVKKILLRVIALVILFLAIMIVMKLINGSGDENTQNQSVLPSEPIATQDNNNDTSFESMPITDNTSAEDQFEALRKQFQDEQNTTTSSSNNNDTANFAMPDQEVPAEPTATASENTTPQASAPKQEVKQTAKPKEEAKKQTAVKKEKESAKQTPKKEQNANDLFKNVDAKPVHPSGLASGIYVQIFSVSNLDQKSKELASVKQKGYDYKLYKTTVGGKEITKVLIGPFEKADIAAELAKIRKDIAKDAFSFTLK